jgi:hypothetical protein
MFAIVTLLAHQLGGSDRFVPASPNQELHLERIELRLNW